MRTVTRSSRVSSIATPLLIVTTSLDDAPSSEQLFGSVADTVVLGVFAPAGRSVPAVDLRDAASALAPAPPIAAFSLDRAPGGHGRPVEIARLISDSVERVGAATVAIGLGLRGGEHLEASDAAFLARRTTRHRVGWIVYHDAPLETDATHIARRRMQLFLRGIRLEPVVVAEAPMGSTTRYWEIRASRDQ